MISDEATETESEEEEDEEEDDEDSSKKAKVVVSKKSSNSVPKKKIDLNEEKADEMEKSLDMEMKPTAESLV